MTTVFNTTSSPVYLPDGSVIGGGEWSDVDTASVQRHIDSGRLIVVGTAPEQPVEPDVVSESKSEDAGQEQDENDPSMKALEGDDSAPQADTMSPNVSRSRAKKE